MSEDKTKTTGDKPADPGHSKVAKAAGELGKRGVVQLFNKKKKQLAVFLVSLLSARTPDKVKWIAEHENEIDTINTIVSAVTPSDGLWELTDDFQQDFVHEVIEACKDRIKTGTPVTTAQVAVDTTVFAKQMEQCSRLDNALSTLPQDKQDDFWLAWFDKLTDAEKDLFYKFLATVNDSHLKAIVQYSPSQLNQMLARIPSAPAPAKTPTVATPPAMPYLQIRASLDPTLITKIKEVVQKSGKDEMAFQKALEKAKVADPDALRAILAMDTDTIINLLGLDKKSFGDKVSEAGEKFQEDMDKAGLSGWLQNRQAFNQKLLDKLATKMKKGGRP